MEFSNDDFLKGLWEDVRDSWIKWTHRNLSERHCDECLKLDDCWFLRTKAPKFPHHTYCHCLLEPISYDAVLQNAVAKSKYTKFDPYLFNTGDRYSHGKEKMFKSWGYTVRDAKWLQYEIEKQGLEKYVHGDYKLGKLDKEGQRMNIRVEIPRKKGAGTVSFMTGWMVYPNGWLQLATPYADD